jgi:hypothetical protein
MDAGAIQQSDVMRFGDIGLRIECGNTKARRNLRNEILASVSPSRLILSLNSVMLVECTNAFFFVLNRCVGFGWR